MIKLVVNGVIAGFVVIAVSEVARRYPRVAEVILAVPLVVFAVYAVMYLRAPDLAPISKMARQMLVLVPLSLLRPARVRRPLSPDLLAGLRRRARARHSDRQFLPVVHEVTVAVLPWPSRGHLVPSASSRRAT